MNDTSETNDPIFEFVNFKFQAGVPPDEQRALMRGIGPLVSRLEGFVGRNFFFSPESGRWLEMIAWSNLKSARAAAQEATRSPEGGALFSRIDQESVVFGHFRKES